MWIAVAILLVILILYFCYYNNNHITVSKYSLEFKGINGLRIVQLSDLHGKQFGKDNIRLKEKIEALKPDMIVFTGDLIDDDAQFNGGKNVKESISFLLSLTSLCPVFYIYGNHEHRAGLAEHVSSSLERGGVHVLINSVEDILIGTDNLSILGLDEGQASSKSFYKERKKGNFVFADNSEYFRELDKHTGFKIVLSHFPENFNGDGYCYKSYSFDLQLSGHAHGGQFRFPFFGGVYSPGQGIHPRFTCGVYGTHPKMIVSRGLGNSSFPLRLFNCPEIVVIDLKKGEV